MARQRYTRNAFSMGVLSKRVQGNTEFEGYNNALDECVNFQVQQTGGIFKRGGTYFVSETKNGEAVLIVFAYAADAQYICEFGSQYIRFYTKYGVLLDEDGQIVEVETPFTMETIKKMKTFQDGNTLNLVTDQGIFSLRRKETTAFELTGPLVYTSEPLTFMNKEKIALKPSAQSGTITITAVNPAHQDEKPDTKYAPLFFESDVGHFLVLTYTVRDPNTSTFSDKKFYLSINNIADDEDGFKKLETTFDTDQSASGFTELPSTEATTKWQIGAFTADRGMPQAAAVYEGRLFLANNSSYPVGIWGSSRLYNDWADFYSSRNAADAVSFLMHAQHADEILWLVSQSKLFAGTSWGVYMAGSATFNDQAITPDNFGIRLFESIGASPLQPITALDSIFFVDTSGRNVHEIFLSSDTGNYEATDLSLLANDLTRSGITFHAWQQTPIKTYWCAVEDGYLCSLTFVKNNGVLAWTQHIISGKSSKVENLAVMHGENHDLLWMVVRREVNGEFKRYIEYMRPAYDPLQQEEFKQFYVDSGITKEIKFKITNIERGRETVLKFGNMTNQDAMVAGRLIPLNNGLIKCVFSKGTTDFYTENIFVLRDVRVHEEDPPFCTAVLTDTNQQKIKAVNIPTDPQEYTDLAAYLKVSNVFKIENNRIYCDTQFLMDGHNVKIPGLYWESAGVLPVSQYWFSVCYGGGKFVAVADDSDIAAYSYDGITWTQMSMPASARWFSVCYGNGKFVALAIGTADKTAYSTDGITWTEGSIPAGEWRSVCYGGGKFVAVATGGNTAAYSSDGITWTETTLPASAGWRSVAYGNGRFVAVSANNSDIAAYSSDGITWTETTLPARRGWISVCYGNGRFVAVAVGPTDISAYSEDGINWTATPIPTGGGVYICYGDGKFVVLGAANQVAYSEDGINWTLIELGRAYWTSVCYGGGKFVAVHNGTETVSFNWNLEGTVATRRADSIAITVGGQNLPLPDSADNFEIFQQISSDVSLETAPIDAGITVDAPLPAGYAGNVYLNKINGTTQLNGLTFRLTDLSENRKTFSLSNAETGDPIDMTSYSPFDDVNPEGNVYLYFDSVEGLDHLIGQEVAICVDGNSAGNQTVPEDGILHFDRPHMYCSVGLPLKSWLKTTPFSGGSIVGSSVGAVGGQKAMWLNLYYSLGGKYGSEPESLYNIPYNNFIAGFNKTRSLISGLVKCPMINARDIYNRSVYIEHSEPLSFNILSITQDVSVSDA